MKKTISVSLGGIHFHVEEDAYEQLRNYLDGVQRYFTAQGEHWREIVADIEDRIAEILNARMTRAQQTVTVEDVAYVITTMGQVSDFEATADETAAPPPAAESTTNSNEAVTSKKLYRYTSDKILGGVCSGIAHYFSIDSVWIRLFMCALVFGFGTGVLLYALLWICLPAREDLPQGKQKKLYRNPKEKLLGGVASGLGAYLGVDENAVRLAFLISLFLGGVGLAIYVILWILTPEAKTPRDQLRMQGEQVTLFNIGSSFKKKKLTEAPPQTLLPNWLVRGLRGIGNFMEGLGAVVQKILLVLVWLIVGLFFSVTAVICIMALSLGNWIITDIGFTQKWLSWSQEMGISITDLSLWEVICVFGLLFIFSLFFMIAGTALIMRRHVIGAMISWFLAAVFIMSILFLWIMSHVRVIERDDAYQIEKPASPLGTVKAQEIFDLQTPANEIG